MERVAPGVTSWIDQIAGDAVGVLDPPFDLLRDQLMGHAALLQDVATQRNAAAAARSMRALQKRRRTRPPIFFVASFCPSASR